MITIRTTAKIQFQYSFVTMKWCPGAELDWSASDTDTDTDTDTRIFSRTFIFPGE